MNKMLTPHEISEILQISYPTALEFVKRSGIDYIKIGNQYRVCEDKFYAFINRKGSTTVYL